MSSPKPLRFFLRTVKGRGRWTGLNPSKTRFFSGVYAQCRLASYDAPVVGVIIRCYRRRAPERIQKGASAARNHMPSVLFSTFFNLFALLSPCFRLHIPMSATQSSTSLMPCIIACSFVVKPNYSVSRTSVPPYLAANPDEPQNLSDLPRSCNIPTGFWPSSFDRLCAPNFNRP